MLEAIFNFIINLFFWLIGLIGSIVIYPVQALLVTIIPRTWRFYRFNPWIFQYLCMELYFIYERIST